MKEILNNYVDRVPVMGEVPSIDDAFPLEIDGILTATYPRIDMKFLSWGSRTSDNGDQVPKFAVFGLRRPVFIMEGGWGVDSAPRSNFKIAPVRATWNDTFLPIAIRQHFRTFFSKLSRGTTLHIRYSGLMPKRLRVEVEKVNARGLGTIMVVGEVQPSSWERRVVMHEDPLVVLARDDNYWLIGWYDLTSGEDRVLGTMTE
jgi:hypothetical protein